MNQYAFVMLWRAALQAAIAAHVQEQGGNNLGEQVEKYQKACGGSPGESWCMYFQMFYALKVYAAQVRKLAITPLNVVALLQTQWQSLQSAFGLLVTGSCGEQMRFQQKRGKVIFRENIQEILPGWIVLYAWNSSDVAGHIPRHVGMCDAPWRKSTLPIFSLEGNTGTGGDQSDGDGAARKERSFANVVCVIKTYEKSDVPAATATTTAAVTTKAVAAPAPAMPQDRDRPKTPQGN